MSHQAAEPEEPTPATEPEPEAEAAAAPEPEVREVDTSRPKPDEADPDAEVIEGEVIHFPVKADAVGMGLVPVQDELRGIAAMAVTLATSGLVPKALQGKPANVLAVLLTGRELGVAPMTAIRTFHVINGTVTIAPKVRAAMVRQQGLGKLWPHQAPWFDDDGIEHLCRCGSRAGMNDGDIATWHAERADQPGVVFSSTYTLSMAQQVTFDEWIGDGNNRRKIEKKLADKDNWKNYPERMLSWRSLGYLLDDAFPEVGTGLYAPDEIGAVTDEDGVPLLDMDETDPLVPQASGQGGGGGRGRAKTTQQPPAEPPANPAALEGMRKRIAKLEQYEGARDALVALWKAPDADGQPKLPPIDKLLHRQCVVASSIIDLIERRCRDGEFGEAIEDAVIVEPESAPADAEREPAEAESGAQEPGAAEEPEASPEPQEATQSPDLPDYSHLPLGRTPSDDLAWIAEAPPGLMDTVAAEVREAALPDVVSRLKALDLSSAGTEPSKRLRLAARIVRQRMERLAQG